MVRGRANSIQRQPGDLKPQAIGAQCPQIAADRLFNPVRECHVVPPGTLIVYQTGAVGVTLRQPIQRTIEMETDRIAAGRSAKVKWIVPPGRCSNIRIKDDIQARS